MPLAFVMGIPWAQCRLVGKLIGKKIVINEFLAFADLGEYIKAGSIEVNRHKYKTIYRNENIFISKQL
jgi:nucleoside permease NupC